jgi:DNA-binding LytR/AlgR family response regulator
MPRLDGMTLALERAGELPPIIFVTAYDQHALRAFDAGALDYLVKPVRQERLEQALARVHGRRRSPEPVEALLKRLVSGDGGDDACRIAVACGGSVRFFDARQVTRFRSADKYTVFVHGGDELILEESLGALERRLEGHAFVRVHRGELVNLARVRALHSADGIHEVELDDGQRARVSRRSLPALKKALGI